MRYIDDVQKIARLACWPVEKMALLILLFKIAMF